MFNFIFKNLFRRKTRTLLTVLGIAVGVSMIVALGAIGEGMRSGYASMFGGSGADLTLMQKGSYDITMSGVDEQADRRHRRRARRQRSHGHDRGQHLRAGRRVLLRLWLRSAGLRV